MLKLRTIPLRTGLIFTILLMGLITIALVLISKELYSKYAIETQRNAFDAVIRIKTDDLLRQLEKNAGRLALEIQGDPVFRQHFRKGDGTALRALMDDRFNQYYVTADILDLQRIEAWDNNFNRLAIASNGATVSPRDADCDDPAGVAARRIGPARLKPSISRCSAAGKPYVSVVVPVGLRPDGYVNVVVNPVHDLKQLQPSLGIPLRISLPDGTETYRSTDWPGNIDDSLTLPVSHAITNASGRELLQIDMQIDMQRFFTDLTRLRNNLMLVAGVVTILTIMLAYLLTELIIVQPLQEITNRIKHPHLHSNEPADFGASYISEFAELKDLYTLLENQASRDRLTGLASRQEIEKQIASLTSANADPEPEHAVCYVDLDHFKEIIDHYGHVAGEELLKQITQLLNESISVYDTAARVDGDEFAMLLRNCTPEGIRQTISHFNQGIDNLNFIWNGKRLKISVSTGIVRFRRDTDIVNILGTAHTACYLAKDNPDSSNYYYRTGDDAGSAPGKPH